MRVRLGLLLAAVLSLVLVLSVLTVAQAQQAGKVYRIGWLALGPPAAFSDLFAAFRQGMHEHGYVEGNHFRIDVRGADGDLSKLARVAAELVESRVDMIIVGSIAAATEAKRATSEIPIVIIGVADPVEFGLVRSLARPGTNITGLSGRREGIQRKLLELVQATRPRLSRVVYLWRKGAGLAGEVSMRELRQGASDLRVAFDSIEVRTLEDIDVALRGLTVGSSDVLVVPADPIMLANRRRIAELAAAKRIPAIYSYKPFVDSGGLMSYGPDLNDLFRRAARYVDKILKGAHPGELPIEQPTKFELVINLKTAKALGLTIPPSLLLRADQVIE